MQQDSVEFGITIDVVGQDIAGLIDVNGTQIIRPSRWCDRLIRVQIGRIARIGVAHRPHDCRTQVLVVSANADRFAAAVD